MIGTISSITTKIIIGIVVVVGFFYASRMDFEETIIGTMSQEQYQFIKERVGKDDRSAIVDEYIGNRDYYDSIDYYYLYQDEH